MSKRLKSQWDFGELFPPESLRRVHTVSELTASIKKTLEREIGQIWVTGEVTNLRVQSSGHAYFSLKDSSAQLNCVLFRGEALHFDRRLLQDGQKVVLQGDLTVYEARGQYQLRVTTVELQGLGALQAAFERLKQKLQAEGLFAPERKRPLPRYPQRIGLVTSPSGAAIRDVIHVIARRQPSLEIVLAPCRVQGQGASVEIVNAIGFLNRWAAQGPDSRLDLILLTRGGGSLEDLWAFNEELVARAIAASAIPVISAVGHEIDFTISDFVADYRAATPSAAAEIITEGAFASREFISDAATRLRELLEARLAACSETLENLLHRLTLSHPRRRMEEQAQRLDDLQSDLSRAARQGLRECQISWQSALLRLAHVKPSLALGRRRDQLGLASTRLVEHAKRRREALQAKVTHAASQLRLLSPQNVLERGYSITLDDTSGRIIRHASDANPGQRLLTCVQSGKIISVVERTAKSD